MAEIQPSAIEPPVFLSKLFLENGNIKACVYQCDKLLKLLGIPENRTISNFQELSALFLKAGRFIKSSHGNLQLVEICNNIVEILTYSSLNASSNTD
jgi:hypothetical protein